MIMKANKQIGFIYKNNESIDKILKDGDVVFEKGFLREKTSTTLPITFGGVGKDLKDYKIYGNTIQSKLPSGYTQVDYIESSGTQYIDTGVNADNKLDIKYDVEKTTSGGLVSGTIYNDNGSYTRYHIGINNDKYSFYILQDSSLLTITNDTNIKHSFYINTTTRKVTIDGVDYQLPNTTLTDTQLNFWLFGRNSNINNLRNYGTFKLYSCKMYYNNVLVRDFIPCYRNSDNEIGLYDLVNNVFYTNQGTGVFTYGSLAPTPDTPIDMISCGDLITDSQDENYGKYKIPVNVRSDNLFDKAKVTNGYYIDSNGDLISHNSFAYSDYIQIKENTVYSYSGSTGLANYARKCAWYDSSKNLIRVDNFGNSGQLTSPNNAKYFRTTVRIIASGTQGADINTYQLVKGSTTPSKYIPYYNETTNIYLDEPLRKIDGYSDYIDFINGKVVRNIDEIVLDGSESWTNSAISGDVLVHRFRTLGEKAHVVDIGFSDKFIIRTSDIDIRSDIEMVQFSSSTSNKYIGLKIKKSRLITDDVAGLTTWLSSNNVILNYVLLNSEETSITLPSIPTIDGNNTLNIETELTPSQVYIKYKSNL